MQPRRQQQYRADLQSIGCFDSTLDKDIEFGLLQGLTIGDNYIVRVYSSEFGFGFGSFNICVTTPPNPCDSIIPIAACDTPISVTIPSGIDDNEIIVIENKGNVVGENVGDIKCCIKINNDTVYIRQGMDLRYKRELSLKEALCGFSFPIYHLDGKTYNINNTMGRIISPGMKQIIPKLGMKRGEPAIYGNLIIDFEIKFPETLSQEQRETLSNTL